MYQAIVTRIDVTPHPDPEVHSIAVGNLFNGVFNVIVNKTTQTGTLGVFFPEDGRLTQEFLLANNLYRKNPETGEPMGGFFEENGRVRVQKFRGIKSVGIWLPLNCLDYLHMDVSGLKEGDRFTEIGGTVICEKYVSPHTLRRQGQTNNQRGHKLEIPFFFKHQDSDQWAYANGNLRNGDILTFTEKLHGTSGRYFKTKEINETPIPWWNLKQRLTHGKTMREETTEVYVGSRNVVLGKVSDGESSKNTFYGGDKFRFDIGAKFAHLMCEGETVYGEIVGYDNNGSPFFHHNTKADKPSVKTFSENMVYSYGCNTVTQPNMFHVYRITQVSVDGKVVELSDSQMRRRSVELGLTPVPLFETSLVYHNDLHENVMKIVTMLTEDRVSVLDDRHISEGCVVRVDAKNGQTYFLKSKAYLFKLFEGIVKEKDDYVDVEESA